MYNTNAQIKKSWQIVEGKRPLKLRYMDSLLLIFRVLAFEWANKVILVLKGKFCLHFILTRKKSDKKSDRNIESKWLCIELYLMESFLQ